MCCVGSASERTGCQDPQQRVAVSGQGDAGGVRPPYSARARLLTRRCVQAGEEEGDGAGVRDGLGHRDPQVSDLWVWVLARSNVLTHLVVVMV